MARLLLLLISLSFFSCSPKGEIIRPPENLNMTPIQGEGENIGSQYSSSEEQGIQDILPLIPIDSNYRVILIEETNLDNDGEDEQILITQQQNVREDGIQPLEIWIADFKKGRNEYSLTWRKELKAEVPETISILFKDLTGTLNDEILVLGFTFENSQSLEIFYSPSTVDQFRSIFGKTVMGSMEIKYQEQSFGSATQNPITIEINQQDPNSNNPMDIHYSLWTLNQNTHQFYQSSQRRIAQDDQQQEELRAILQGNEEVFLDHLNGFWYKEEQQGKSLLYFNTRENNIIFFRGNEMELYENSYIHKGIYSKIYINCINSNIKNTSRNLTITLQELDRITMVVQDNNNNAAIESPWTGSYRPMSEELMMDLRLPVDLPLQDNQIQLRGKFRGNNGDELNFETPPLFTHLIDDNEKNGSYSILRLEENLLLELNYFNTQGQKEHQEYYALTLREESDENYIVRSLILTPGTLDIGGFQPSGERNRSFEQIVVADDQDETAQN